MSVNTTQKQHTAGILDIRNVIGALLGIYGVILTLMGLFGDTETDKTDGINANLWAGLIMLAVGIFFVAWVRVKPVVVPEDLDTGGDDPAYMEKH
ncbi:MAG: hypothetical protein JWO76_3348 [Nocardioides sp.]|nr:hypothetical protein [Nocardioides sp.]